MCHMDQSCKRLHLTKHPPHLGVNTTLSLSSNLGVLEVVVVTFINITLLEKCWPS